LIAAGAAAVTVAVSVAPRIAFDALGAGPDWARELRWSDLATAYGRGLAGHHLPYWEVLFDYPPIAGYVAAVLSLLTTDVLGFLVGWAILVAGIAAVTAYAFARAYGLWRTLIFWSLSPQLLLSSGANVDVLAAALLALGISLERRGQIVRSAAVVGTAAATKFYPIVLAPLSVLRALRARGARGAAASIGVLVAVIAVLFGPALLGPYPVSIVVAYYLTSAFPFPDSVFGLASLVLTHLGVREVDTITYGLSLVGLVLTYLIIVLPRGLRAHDPAVGAALAVLALLLWTRRYSPAYSLWALPFFLQLPLPPAAFVVLGLGDVLVFLGWMLGPLADPAVIPFLVVPGVVARHAGLVAATWLIATMPLEER